MLPNLTYAENLNSWLNSKHSSMPFAVPIIWRQSTNHLILVTFALQKYLFFQESSNIKLNIRIFLQQYKGFFMENVH